MPGIDQMNKAPLRMARARCCWMAGVLAATTVFATLPVALAGDAIVADGSSTVYPLTREAARRFQRSHGDVSIDVSFSGSTAGFRRFCAGELDISNASRAMNAQEAAACDAEGVRYRQLPIAMDAIAVVVHPRNRWAKDISVTELRALWAPAAEGKVKTWKDVRPEWPAKPIVLFGRGQDSGTYDTFTTEVVGATRSSRMDYTASEDEEALAKAIADEPNALGFFGIGAYHRHWDELKLIAIDNGAGAIYPTLETVKQGQYQPLTRPLFLYVNEQRLSTKPALVAFLSDYLGGIAAWIHFTGFMPLMPGAYQEGLKTLHTP